METGIFNEDTKNEISSIIEDIVNECIKSYVMKTLDRYLPVHPDFYEVAELFLLKEVKVIYFGLDNTLEESKGIFKEIVKNSNGEFLHIINDKNVRLDRIITINGKVGPAFDEYDAYANACLSCQAGYDD